jgi:hypothetical protein
MVFCVALGKEPNSGSDANQVPHRRRRSRDYTAYICLHRLRTTTSNIRSRVNGATDALSISPSAGYNLFFVFVHILLFLLLM